MEVKFQLIEDGKIVGIERLVKGWWEWRYFAIDPDNGERWTIGTITGNPNLIRRRFTGKKCYYNETDYQELYEGDILETVDGFMICVWNDDQCCFQIENKKYCYTFHQIDVTTKSIVGSIYANPDMMK